MQQPGDDSEARIAGLRASGYDVVDVDPFHLHWTKLADVGQWHAIIVHHTCFSLILGELAAELAMSSVNTETQVILITDGENVPEMPSPLAQCRLMTTIPEQI